MCPYFGQMNDKAKEKALKMIRHAAPLKYSMSNIYT